MKRSAVFVAVLVTLAMVGPARGAVTHYVPRGLPPTTLALSAADSTPPPTPADQHAMCVDVFGEAECRAVECVLSFGPGGCPKSGFTTKPIVLGLNEARRALDRGFLTDLRGVGFTVPRPRCRSMNRADTVRCVVTLRPRPLSLGVSCRAGASVVERLTEYMTALDAFRCRRG